MTHDDEPPQPSEDTAPRLSKERAEELERARTALLQWMTEQIVNELIEEARLLPKPGDEARESPATPKLQKTAAGLPVTTPSTSQPTHPGAVPPRWKPESET